MPVGEGRVTFCQDCFNLDRHRMAFVRLNAVECPQRHFHVDPRVVQAGYLFYCSTLSLRRALRLT